MLVKKNAIVRLGDGTIAGEKNQAVAIAHKCGECIDKLARQTFGSPVAAWLQARIHQYAQLLVGKQ